MTQPARLLLAGLLAAALAGPALASSKSKDEAAAEADAPPPLIQVTPPEARSLFPVDILARMRERLVAQREAPVVPGEDGAAEPGSHDAAPAAPAH